MIVGGEAGDVFTPPLVTNDPTAGGAEFGGEAGELFGFTDATEGGAEFGGEAGDVPEFNDETEGGAEFGGEAGDGYGPPVHGEIIYPPGEFTFVAETSADHFVECWGPGGSGLGMVADEEVKCSGGGGGAYSGRTVNLTLGVGYLVVCQSGGSELPSTFEPTVTARRVIAAPGKNATGDLGGEGGQVADCIGDVLFKGGNGAGPTGVPSGGGGGGGGAGSLTDGNDGLPGTNPTGGFGGLGGAVSGGDGANGADAGFSALDGGNAGGGGGGGGTGTTSGGIGGPGRVRITW